MPAAAPFALGLLDRSRSSFSAGVVVPACLHELRDGGRSNGNGELAPPADFGVRRSAGVADDPDMRGLDEK
jgi:hypothetical protein